MLTQLMDGLAAPIGVRYLKNKNKLVFVEYAGGTISTLDLVKPAPAVLSSGRILLKGTWTFDCESGTLGSDPAHPTDIWWEQIDHVRRQMVPRGAARIVNLGHVDFAGLTPAAMQQLAYSTTPIPGSNDLTNRLTNGDVFCVRTREGNLCKIRVLNYDYNLLIEWITYQLESGYHTIGRGYTTPEDIFVLADERTAYVTERTGNLLKVDLTNADRAHATLVTGGLSAPQQLQIDEANQEAYLVEFARPGRLLRVNLAAGGCTTLSDRIDLGIGLLVTADRTTAYVSEQGGTVSRIALGSGVKTVVATGLVNPFFMTWTDPRESAILIAERDGANRISLISLSGAANPVRKIADTAPRPSGLAFIKPNMVAVTTAAEIYQADFMAAVTDGIYKGIGYVPFNLINADGKADTSPQPDYPFQFYNVPFGGTLQVMVNHYRAWEAGLAYYRVLIDGVARKDTWNDLALNPVTGKYDTIVAIGPDPAHPDGYYKVHNPTEVYLNDEMGCMLNSTSLTNAKHTIQVVFYDGGLGSRLTTSHPLLVDNNLCAAVIDMPSLDGHTADMACGVLGYSDLDHFMSIHYAPTHPNNFASYSFQIIRGGSTYITPVPTLSHPVAPPPADFTMRVRDVLGSCRVAAFAMYLYVAASATNGVWRQSQYDAARLMSFCLAP